MHKVHRVSRRPGRRTRRPWSFGSYGAAAVVWSRTTEIAATTRPPADRAPRHPGAPFLAGYSDRPRWGNGSLPHAQPQQSAVREHARGQGGTARHFLRRVLRPRSQRGKIGAVRGVAGHTEVMLGGCRPPCGLRGIGRDRPRPLRRGQHGHRRCRDRRTPDTPQCPLECMRCHCAVPSVSESVVCSTRPEGGSVARNRGRARPSHGTGGSDGRRFGRGVSVARDAKRLTRLVRVHGPMRAGMRPRPRATGWVLIASRPIASLWLSVPAGRRAGSSGSARSSSYRRSSTCCSLPTKRTDGVWASAGGAHAGRGPCRRVGPSQGRVASSRRRRLPPRGCGADRDRVCDSACRAVGPSRTRVSDLFVMMRWAGWRRSGCARGVAGVHVLVELVLCMVPMPGRTLAVG